MRHTVSGAHLRHATAAFVPDIDILTGLASRPTRGDRAIAELLMVNPNAPTGVGGTASSMWMLWPVSTCLRKGMLSGCWRAELRMGYL